MPWLPLSDRHRNAVDLLHQGKATAKQAADDVVAMTDQVAQIEGEIWGKASGWEACDPCIIPREANPYVPADSSPTVPHVPDAPAEPGPDAAKPSKKGK